VLTAPDRRQDANKLAALAKIVASKFFVHWMRMELVNARPASSQHPAAVAEALPATWQSIHDYARALNALDGLR
jgi:hypothetical protein